MDLFKFDPIDKPPRTPEDDWPSEEERRERRSHLEWGHIKCFPKGFRRVIDAVPHIFLEPIIYSSLPNVAAFNAVLAFHSIGPGDGRSPQLKLYLKSISRGLIAFGPPRTGKTRSLFARLIQLYVWGAEDFCWIRAYDLAALALDKKNDGDCKRLIARLATFQDNVFLDDFDIAKFHPRYAEALYGLVDDRVSEELPILLTTQTTGDEFVERVAGRNRHLRYLAQSIVGRLRESCDCVDFGHGISGSSKG
ncbi:MAG TPA: hypothetical protein VGI41_05920 [Candidatus Udaeobacter sp.]